MRTLHGIGTACARLLAIAAVIALTTSAKVKQKAPPSWTGRWQYLQPPDLEGEVLDLRDSSGHWRGIMNGLERAGEHGLFYYVVAVESLQVEPGGNLRFVVGERSLFSRRPPLSTLLRTGDAGVNRYLMRFNGRLEAGDLVLRCVDPGGSCPDSTLRFKKVHR